MKDTDPGMEKLVASFTGAWIETNMVAGKEACHQSRILYGCVD